MITLENLERPQYEILHSPIFEDDTQTAPLQGNQLQGTQLQGNQLQGNQLQGTQQNGGQQSANAGLTGSNTLDDKALQQLFKELVESVFKGQKDNDIKQLDAYQDIVKVAGSIRTSNDDSKKALDTFTDLFGKFMFVLKSAQDENAQLLFGKIIENFNKIPAIVQKASLQEEGKLSLKKDLQETIKTIRQRMQEIANIKGSDKAKADAMLKQLMKDFPDTATAIQLMYDNIKTGNNGQQQLPNQNNNLQQQ